MKEFWNAAWIFVEALRVAGFAVGLAGVAVFGWYFVQINGAAAKGESGKIPWQSWRGPRAMLAMKIFAAGVVLTLAAALLSAIMPSRL